MRVSLRAIGFYALVGLLELSVALAENGSWKFGTEDRGHPELVYSENDKIVFMVVCGRAFGVHAVYPGDAKKEGEKATITISTVKTRMQFDGEIDSSYEGDPPNTRHFVQWDLGFFRQDPELFGKKWRKIESRLFDLLDSGQPLTIAAEGKNYVLPAVKASNWKKRFKEKC
jgi:hypothetical protein